MPSSPIQRSGPAAASRAPAISDKAKVWAIELVDGRLEGRLDPTLLARLGGRDPIDLIIDALISASAEQHIAETRSW